ncbi:MAG: hypothetical protein ACLQIB_04495 [Isosphaeraceae bacterium]
MREAPSFRFNLRDALVMIAAVTPGLILIRVAVGLGLFELGKLTGPGGRPSTLARQLVEMFNVGGGCLLAGLVPAVLILGLYRAWPSWREAARGPGLVTCFVAVAAAILPLLWLVGNLLIESRSPYPVYSVTVNNFFGRWILAAGPMILGAWITLAFLGRWRPNRTWTDQAGYILGLGFALIYLYMEIYFDVVLPIHRWWSG